MKFDLSGPRYYEGWFAMALFSNEFGSGAAEAACLGRAR